MKPPPQKIRRPTFRALALRQSECLVTVVNMRLGNDHLNKPTQYGSNIGFARILPHKFKKDRAPSVWEKILPAPKVEEEKEEPKRYVY